jgi:hypothetical protein
MRESPTYRTNLQQLNERFEHEVLTISEVAAFIGKSKNTAKKRFPFICRTDTHTGGCTKTQLAKALSEGR